MLLNAKSKPLSFLVSLSYDGSSFSGWARQKKELTVQGLIEEKLSLLFSQNVHILASSRTDKGVHALDQNFSFRIRTEIPCDAVVRIVEKSFQRSSIVINSVQRITDLSFHPISSVFYKEYTYKVNAGSFDQFANKYLWNYNKLIDINNLKKIVTVFEGTHDFFNFSFCRLKDRDKVNTVRTIDKITVHQEEKLILIKFVATGFLRYQIRAVVGEVFKFLESGSNSLDGLKKRLDGFSVDKYKVIAPPSGLYLSKIVFKNLNNDE